MTQDPLARLRSQPGLVGVVGIPRRLLKSGALAVAGVALENQRAGQRDDRWSPFDDDAAAESAP